MRSALATIVATLLGGCILERNPDFQDSLALSAGGSGDAGDGTGGGTAGPTTGATTDGDAGSGPTSVVEVCSGLEHSCAVRSDGSVWCWGINRHGQLGDGTFTTSSTPVQVALSVDATSVTCGIELSCAVASDTSVWCWGLNHRRGLGYAGAFESPVPTRVPGLTNVATVAAGEQHACAAHLDGTLSCWGDNYDGQSGTFDPGPAVFDGIEGVTRVAAGALHSCALGSDGSVRCWGSNNYGSVGAPFSESEPEPILVDIDQVVDIRATRHSTCALRSDKSVWCWGTDDYNRLGPEVRSPVDADPVGRCSRRDGRGRRRVVHVRRSRRRPRPVLRAQRVLRTRPDVAAPSSRGSDAARLG